MHSRNSARSQLSGRDCISYSPPRKCFMTPQRTASSTRLDCNYWKARRAQSRFERGPLLHGSGIRSHLCEHPRRCYQAIGQIAVHNYVASTPAFLRGRRLGFLNFYPFHFFVFSVSPTVIHAQHNDTGVLVVSSTPPHLALTSQAAHIQCPSRERDPDPA